MNEKFSNILFIRGKYKINSTTIANTINADILELKTKKKYSDKGFRKYFWGGRDVLFNSKPDLEKVNTWIKELME